ncbi:MAG: hypothetical protein R3D33_13175 [Hyphomicrobiaceae bacterium]
MSDWGTPASNYDTDDIWRKDRDHFVHPWTHFDSFKKDGSLVITEGRGAYAPTARAGALSRRHRRSGASISAMAAPRWRTPSPSR